ncbi:MAG: N-acylglucosamine 2-epimerase [Sphingobacteriia bacterium 24-36-13]|uniref:AGE family epimerase/isomerase n=1 Tax=Sediminibacterium sp. TaxID=1917865 RepID=UPI000BD01F47|nr:AGE family epimerase/isomerase [Sediminibacterium sp.]OYY10693.1 MAG: N-acylglucosamine 2-epimerase [Sphingobacteriia bacterium 35-36-14]OYZ53016.1 MAG: N-acylglucosamine 2-epimerase [Sphingobacteriia bacterium 24-36-13]OZA63749.1 MAG: N-acylglucosamine 2-epimerase [Sphingobacteriia bacterium 39-36-14]HQS23179.1 AGE family epimerase/isomerase [Sediminibacterium sp.]HQS35868.1 AGE family epimerase/isomerase [Sediminibacterium sp.]
MMYANKELEELAAFYSNQLLNSTIPFWFPRSFDQEHGGFLLMRDADGSLIDNDKAVWIQGRATWMLATLYNTVEQKPEWLAGAKLGYDFLNKYCFDTDGQMFFHVTRDGKPIRKRRYFFSETFYVIAAAAYAKASGDETAAANARRVFDLCIQYATTPGLLQPKYTNTRPSKGIGVPMIMMNTAQQLRETIGYTPCDEWITKWIEEIERFFVKDDIQCVMEQVAPDGSIIDHIDGRTLNPGHAIEGAWFILHEAKHRNNDPHLINLGCRMLDYMWERGWDKEQGGILYFRDVYNKPVQEYWQDMKFWWPHNEVIIATLLAYIMTGNPKYATWHKMVHDYAYANFLDMQHGEWFGYLHRDGTVAQTAKGNLYKGPFHLPRQEWYCMQLLKSYLS